MQGHVNQICKTTLFIVTGDRTTVWLLDAVIDTGFSRFLTLLSEIISILGLNWQVRDIATLRDGTANTFKIHLRFVN